MIAIPIIYGCFVFAGVCGVVWCNISSEKCHRKAMRHAGILKGPLPPWWRSDE